jgi:phosphonate transport system ATP-binding protein
LPSLRASGNDALVPRREPTTQPAGETVLRFRDVSFSYDGRTPVLRNIDLAVGRGEVVMMLGRSGGGKTTLLRLAHGLLQPSSGSIELAMRGPGRVAWVPQTLGLVRSTSALDNTLTGAIARMNTVLSLARIIPRAIRIEAHETLGRVGLSGKRDEPVARLSGGERQRVALARALMQRPELIVADEFVSQLDPLTTDDILTLVRQIAARGVSCVVATHEIDVVERFADRVIVLRDGRIAFDGPPDTRARSEFKGMLA